jgi:dynein heavy chain
VPNDTDELVELLKYIEMAKTKDLMVIREEINKGKKRLDFLLTYSFMNEEDIKLNGVTFTWPSRIMPIFDLSKKISKLKSSKRMLSLTKHLKRSTNSR